MGEKIKFSCKICPEDRSTTLLQMLQKNSKMSLLQFSEIWHYSSLKLRNIYHALA